MDQMSGLRMSTLCSYNGFAYAKGVNESKRDCITLRRALNDDLDRFLRWCIRTAIRDIICWVKFCCGTNLVQDDRFVLVGSNNRNGHMPKSEPILCNIIESGCLLGLDEVLEVANCLGRPSFDRESQKCRHSIDTTEQGQTIVGSGVVKHQMKRKVKKDERCNRG